MGPILKYPLSTNFFKNKKIFSFQKYKKKCFVWCAYDQVSKKKKSYLKKIKNICACIFGFINHFIKFMRIWSIFQ